MTALSLPATLKMLAEDAPDRPVRQQAVATFTLARLHAWEGVDNLAVARRLLFMRRRFLSAHKARRHVR